MFEVEKLKKLLNSTNSKDLAFEAQFRSLNLASNKLESSINILEYNRLYKYLKAKYLEKEELSTVYNSNNISKIVSDNKVIWQKKTPVSNLDDQNYDIRFDATIKEKLDNYEQKLEFNSIRIRNRVNFVIDDSTIVELTKIQSTDKNVCVSLYEAEVQLTNNDLNQFLNNVEILYKQVKGTNLLYTRQVRDQLVKDIAPMFNARGVELRSKDLARLDIDAVVKTRNIKYKDLVYGGVVGNQGYESKVMTDDGPCHYCVTIKADGERQMLALHKTGVWLLYPPYEFNLVSTVNYRTSTVFDGELVNNNIYLAFDCLGSNNQSVKMLSYLRRMEYAEDLARTFNNTDNFSIKIKPYELITTVEDYFRIVPKFIELKSKQEYEDDGLLFIPNEVIYNPESKRGKARDLTNTPYIVKWKDPSKLSIDFRIKWTNNLNKTNKLELYVRSNKKDVIFLGTERFPLTKIDLTNPLLKNLESCVIVEFLLVNNVLTPYRIRDRKTEPNGIDNAKDLWNELHEPMTAADLTGRTTALMRRYHNVIKTELYNSLPRESNILDLGGGRGADLHKWRDIGANVLTTEPLAKNRRELIQRAQKYNVKVLDYRAEETDKITKAVDNYFGQKVDAVSLMLTLSFFFESEENLNQLIQTIVNNLKPDGQIIFLTIDDQVEKVFLDPETKFLTGAVLTRRGQELDVYFPNSIVGEDDKPQTEWIVHIDQLSKKLANYGFNLIEFDRADKELLLSSEGKLLSSLYSYGKFSGNKLVSNKMSNSPKRKLNKSKDETVVKLIPVNTRVGAGQPGINDDAIEKVVSSWYDNVVRLGTIGDGNCYFHALLKGFYKPYQNDNGASYRIKLVEDLRRDLAANLVLENPDYLGYTYWETVADGSFADYLMDAIKYPQNISFNKTDFSPQSLQRLLNSHTAVGNEVFKYVPEALKIDVYIVEATNKDLYSISYFGNGLDRNAVVIMGDGCHYETIGIDNGVNVQTVFAYDDPFIVALKEFNPPVFKQDFNPDAKFLDNLWKYFGNGELNLQLLYKAFPNSNDLVRKIVDRVTGKVVDKYGQLDDLVKSMKSKIEDDLLVHFKQMMEFYFDNYDDLDLRDAIVLAGDTYNDEGIPDLYPDVVEVALTNL